jgi:hypothetical protein
MDASPLQYLARQCGRVLTGVALFVLLIAAPLTATPSAAPAPGGYFTTPAELAAIKQQAARTVEPHATHVAELLALPVLATPHYWIGQTRLRGPQLCSDGTQRDAQGRRLPRGPTYLVEGGRLVYAKMLAAHLHPDRATAEAYARDARRRILELTNSTDWGGNRYNASNQCILYLSWYVNGFVSGADLLETFPQIWKPEDRRTFEHWLANHVYPKVAWASRARTGNWGSAGSYAAALIGDYLNASGRMLIEVQPERRSITPAAAYREHTAEQLQRMSTTIASRDELDAKCLPYKGIQPSGGIPEELRRADLDDPLVLCNATYLPAITGPYEPAYIYQMTQIEDLIAHAELAWRRGDDSLYTNRAADDSGSLLRAIHFVIANPSNPNASYDWDNFRKAQLFVANRFYNDPAIGAQLGSGTLRGGDIVTYGRLTHATSPNP